MAKRDPRASYDACKPQEMALLYLTIRAPQEFGRCKGIFIDKSDDMCLI